MRLGNAAGYLASFCLCAFALQPFPDMSPSTFLPGKLRKFSLPVIATPVGPDAPNLKRLLLPQGELAQFYDSDEPVRYLAFIELRAGSTRGNHYHQFKEEWLYLIQGELL